MTRREKMACDALIAISAMVALSAPRGRELDVWRVELRDLLPDCHAAPEVMVPVRASVAELLRARSSMEIGNALARLRHQVNIYYLQASGVRVETWREARRETAA